MNFYIQGNPERAEEIKAAFDSKGIRVPDFRSCGEDSLIYFSLNKEVLAVTIKALELFEETPNYKELELPVETNFEVGNWVVFNNNHNSIYQISEIKNFLYILTHIHGGKMALSFSQRELLRPWTIADAEDGDVLVTTKVRSCPFIYRKASCDSRLAHFYAGIDGDENFSEGCLKGTLFHFGPASDVVPATEEQRDLLFKKMKEAGYEWNAKKKELHKIQHYDISDFKPKQWVLVRDDDEWEWTLTRFSHLSSGSASLFVCINGASFQQCIPFDGNEKLLGTTDMPDEMYINWQRD